MADLRNIDWNELKSRMADYATSEVARERLVALDALSDSTEAQDSVQLIMEATLVLNTGKRPHMESLDLFHNWFSRLEKKATLRNLELRDLRHFCHEILALKEVLTEVECARLDALALSLLPAEEPLSAIDQVLTADGNIRHDASEKIYQLTTEKNQKTQELQSSLDRLVKDFDMEDVLQDKYVTTREGRWVLPVKSGMRHSLEGVIHSASQSKQTVFMEPQLVVPLNNRLRQIEVELEEEIERLLTELSHYLFSQVEAFRTSHGCLLEFDVRLAEAQLTIQLEAQGYNFTNDEISLQELRHPLLVLNGVDVITNNVSLNQDKRILLLSGPNAGGKTVLMKSIGLALQMARCGLPIAAGASSKIPFLKNVTAAVGDEQSVDENLSTFAAHLKKLDLATKSSGPQELILIDEICGSTDPEEGSALARSFIEVYIKNKCYAVITSHLSALKKDWPEDSGLVHGSLEFDSHKGPTYQLFEGMPGQSLAISTARRVGVEEAIVDRATELLSPETRKYQEDLKELEGLKESLHRIQRETMDEKKAMHAEKMKYEKLMTDFEKEKGKKLEKAVKEASQRIDDEIKTAKVQDVFRKHEQADKLKHDLPSIVKKGSGTQQGPIENAEQFAERFPPGTKVFISGVNQDGLIQGAPNSKGEVPVLSRSMRMTVPWQQLRPSGQAGNPTREILRKTGQFSSSPSDEDHKIDLRGKRVDEAIQELEIQLDAAAMHGQERAKIIHGHGTDTLKRAVRSYLSRSVYVKKWQAGTPKTGGDGITWAELAD